MVTPHRILDTTMTLIQPMINKTIEKYLFHTSFRKAVQNSYKCISTIPLLILVFAVNEDISTLAQKYSPRLRRAALVTHKVLLQDYDHQSIEDGDRLSSCPLHVVALVSTNSIAQQNYGHIPQDYEIRRYIWKLEHVSW